jgi:hypothetical protein
MTTTIEKPSTGFNESVFKFGKSAVDRASAEDRIGLEKAQRAAQEAARLVEQERATLAERQENIEQLRRRRDAISSRLTAIVSRDFDGEELHCRQTISRLAGVDLSPSEASNFNQCAFGLPAIPYLKEIFSQTAEELREQLATIDAEIDALEAK